MRLICLLYAFMALLQYPNARTVSNFSLFGDSNPSISSFNGAFLLNPAYTLNRYQQNQNTQIRNTNDSLSQVNQSPRRYIIEGGLELGYLGIDELNPVHLTLSTQGESLGLAVGMSGINSDLFQDFNFQSACGYQLTDDIAVGASYSLSMFMPEGYNRIIQHQVGLSLNTIIDIYSKAYVIFDDLTDSRLNGSNSEYIVGRQLIAGYVYDSGTFGGGIDFQVSEAGGGVRPFVFLTPIDGLRVFAKAQSVNRMLGLGLAIDYNEILMSSQVAFSDRLGSDFMFTIGYRI